MNLISYKAILAAALVITGCFAGHPVSAATKESQEVTDARQETQIWTTYALSPYLRANNLEVSVHKGKATLTGTVEEDVNKDLAKQIALGVNGIKEVDNQITVKADYTPAKSNSEERSYGQTIDDASITAVVKSKLLWSKYTDGLSTNVDTKSGRVILKGTADSEAAKTQAGRLAKNTHGVVSVDNQLKVEDGGDGEGIMNSAKNSVMKSGSDISDSWITTKVKSTFMYSNHVDSAGISVTTKEGVVTLNGKVDSDEERELAIELAQNVRGVKSVQSMGLTI